jgi:hypothetical protein
MFAFTEELTHEHQATLRAEAKQGRRAATMHRAQQMRRHAMQALSKARRASLHTG